MEKKYFPRILTEVKSPETMLFTTAPPDVALGVTTGCRNCNVSLQASTVQVKDRAKEALNGPT
jgi:hypothetical protein